MKILIMGLLLAFNVSAEINRFIIDNYKLVPNMEYQIELVVKNPLESNRLLLDCQSFINGLHYSQKIENQWIDFWFVMLSGNDCEDSMRFSVDAVKKSQNFCLSVDILSHQLDFNADVGACNPN